MKLTRSFIKQVIMEEMQAMQEVGMEETAYDRQDLASLKDDRAMVHGSLIVAQKVGNDQLAKDIEDELKQIDSAIARKESGERKEPPGPAAGGRALTWRDIQKGRTVANVD